jgi:hypothetical protein
MHFKYPKQYTHPHAPYFKYASYNGKSQALIVWFNNIVDTQVFYGVTWETIHRIRILLRTTNSWFREARNKDTMVWNFVAVY